MQRAYVIVYLARPSTGKRAYLLGLESVIHPRARAEMREKLAKPSAHSQREHLKQLILDDKPPLVATKGGRIAGHGPWQGGNFGGTLLIGRAALFGGRVQRGEAVKDCAVRELVEELRLPTSLLSDETARTALTDALDYIGAEAVPQGHHYFSLNLSDERLQANDAVREACTLDAIVINFTLDATTNADRVEKRALKLVDEREFIDALRYGPTSEDLMVIERDVTDLARELCDILDIAEMPRSLVNHLVAYQRSRSLPGHADMAEKFVMS